MKLMRTAGPLGRLFGFSLQVRSFWFAFNAGHYLVSTGVNSVACLYLSKWELWVYSSRIGLDRSFGGSKA
jgi:hypothetical protein